MRRTSAMPSPNLRSRRAWRCRSSGAALISVNDYDKSAALKIARDLHRMGFTLYATPGTADFLRHAGLPVETVNKMAQGSPHTVDLIRGGQVQLDPEHAPRPARPHRWRRDPRRGHRDGRAAAHHAFRGHGGRLRHPSRRTKRAALPQPASPLRALTTRHTKKRLYHEETRKRREEFIFQFFVPSFLRGKVFWSSWCLGGKSS